MTQYIRTTFQLKDQNGVAISDTGGVVQVNTAGDAAKAAIYDVAGVAQTNAKALTSGGVEFYNLSTVASVDLYIQAPGGQFLTRRTVATGGHYDLVVNTDVKAQLYVIPFAIGDATAAVEKDTLFNIPTSAQVLCRLSGCGVRITTADAGQTIVVGLLSTESGGNANGFITATSTTNAIQMIGANGSFFSTNAPHLADAVVAKSISYTLDASTNTAEGFILLPVILE
jgi:hypothetical protein